MLDITNEESVNTAAKSILQSAGAIDILINATGIGIIKPMEQLTTEDMMKSIAVNLLGPFHLIKAFLPSMKEQKKALSSTYREYSGKPRWQEQQPIQLPNMD